MRRLFQNALIWLLFLIVELAAGRAMAAELVYVHELGCPYCRQWERQIGPVYDKTSEGRHAALKPIDKRDSALARLKLTRPVRYTPTFILMDDGAEIGRIEGYPGEDFFWSRLGRLVDKLPADQVGMPAAKDQASRNSPLSVNDSKFVAAARND